MSSRNVPYAPPVLASGVAYFKSTCVNRGLSSAATDALLLSLSPKTLQAYERYWSQFARWLGNERNNIEISVPLVTDFLLYKFKEGYNSNTLSIMRSALNYFPPKTLQLGKDPYVSQLFKYFYRMRPIQSKYITFWPISKVLDLLSSWHPPNTIAENFNL